jgi:hypothetical protein
MRVVTFVLSDEHAAHLAAFMKDYDAESIDELCQTMIERYLDFVIMVMKKDE